MTKIAIVTGGNSGIGFATAKLLKEKKYEVYIIGRNKKDTEKSATKLGVKFVIADLMDSSKIKKVAASFANDGVDVLVNNAGIAHPRPIEMYSIDDFYDHINTNLKAPLFLIHHLLSSLEKQKGCIINVSSIITKKGAPGFGIYAATKGAIEAFTRNIAIELSSKNIRVNAICPGAIDTPIFDKFGLNKEQVKLAKEHALSTIPLRRFGKANEIAQVILSQIESTYVTGSIWNVDGGVDT